MNSMTNTKTQYLHTVNTPIMSMMNNLKVDLTH